jgi:hypothetical protein
MLPLTLFGESQPVVGRKAAERYFQRNPNSNSDYQPLESGRESRSERELPGFEFLMLNLGSFVGSESYFWGPSSPPNVGRANYGVTYLFDQWHSLDRHVRIEFAEYKIEDHQPRKISILPLITFPRAETRFPLFFGFGVGVGVFFNQIRGESDFSLDYQLVGGLRFLDVFNRVGFFAEYAMKNHFLILSDGQFNGSALNTGVVFTF